MSKSKLNELEKEVLKEFICNAIDNDALEEFTVVESEMEYRLGYDESNGNQITLKKKSNSPMLEGKKVVYRNNRGNWVFPGISWLKIRVY